MVEDADLLIAEASFPSTGLGIELQIAEMHDTPILLMFRDYGCNQAPQRQYKNPNDIEDHALQIGDGFVTLMALGLPSIFRTVRYENLQDATEQLAQVIATLEQE